MCNIDIKIRGLEKPTLKEFKNWFDYGGGGGGGGGGV